MKKGIKRTASAGCMPHMLGSTVLGERGQLVVPKEIRECYNMKPGDKFFVLGHGQGPIALLPANQMQSMMAHMNKQLEAMLKEK